MKYLILLDAPQLEKSVWSIEELGGPDKRDQEAWLQRCGGAENKIMYFGKIYEVVVRNSEVWVYASSTK